MGKKLGRLGGKPRTWSGGTEDRSSLWAPGWVVLSTHEPPPPTRPPPHPHHFPWSHCSALLHRGRSDGLTFSFSPSPFRRSFARVTPFAPGAFPCVPRGLTPWPPQVSAQSSAYRGASPTTSSRTATCHSLLLLPDSVFPRSPPYPLALHIDLFDYRVSLPLDGSSAGSEPRLIPSIVGAQ